MPVRDLSRTCRKITISGRCDRPADYRLSIGTGFTYYSCAGHIRWYEAFFNKDFATITRVKRSCIFNE